MPKIKIDSVFSFSSEDSAFSADNILNTDTSKKWKCKFPGEKSATVILQLDKPYIISSIDIGNEHSAYVEVLVNRSGSDDDFKVLLAMSSFMSPLESRQSQNVNKVRMFTQDHLQKPECEEKWDKIKIVCTQPFNRQVQYGLSFITFQTSPNDNTNNTASPTFGKFTLRSTSPDNLSTGSLFARRRDNVNNIPSPAAAIRDASLPEKLAKTPPPVKKQPVIQTTSNSPAFPPKNDDKIPSRNRNQLLYTEDDGKEDQKMDKILELFNEEKEKKKKEQEQKEKEIKEAKTKKTKNEKKESDAQPSSSTSMKRKQESEPKVKKKPKIIRNMKPFYQLLNGVSLVISGIENPERGELRNKALEMGAKYKPNWDNNCTHLISAFVNTPKFNQVRGKGKIVKKNWVLDCYTQRKRLPWRRFALDNKDKGKDESEDEIWEQVGNNDDEDSSTPDELDFR